MKSAETQAEKLGMEPEEYYKRYIEITAEQTAAYILEILGEPEGDEDRIEEYTQKANKLLNDNFMVIYGLSELQMISLK